MALPYEPQRKEAPRKGAPLVGLLDVDEVEVPRDLQDAVVALGVPHVFADRRSLADGDHVGIGEWGAALTVDDDAVAVILEGADGVGDTT